jgi:hypothetical protein
MNVMHVLKSERDKLRRKLNKLDTRNQRAQRERISLSRELHALP